MIKPCMSYLSILFPKLGLLFFKGIRL